MQWCPCLNCEIKKKKNTPCLTVVVGLSLPSLLWASSVGLFCSDPGRDSLSLTCKGVFISVAEISKVKKEAVKSCACACVCVFVKLEGGSRSLLVTMCFSSSIHLSPETQ